MGLGLIIKRKNAKSRPRDRLELAFDGGGGATGRGWVTHVRIDENPGIRGHDLCFDKMCQGNRFAKRAEVEQ